MQEVLAQQCEGAQEKQKTCVLIQKECQGTRYLRATLKFERGPHLQSNVDIMNTGITNFAI